MTSLGCDLDPFAPAFLADPDPGHEALREAGAVVWLTRCRLWAMARWQQVHGALNDDRLYAPAHRLIREPEAPLQPPMRAVLARVLSAAALRRLRREFSVAAEHLAETLVARGRFDAIADLAEAYPVKMFADAFGLGEEGHNNLRACGSLMVDGFGPQTGSCAAAAPARDWIVATCARAALSPDRLGAQIYQAAECGQIGDEEAARLVRAVLASAIGTSVNGLGAALWAFSRHPGQWVLLHREPGLARAAFDEALRWESPVQTWLRATARAVTVGPTRLKAGESVLLFLGAANRDPRRWQEPERFDIRRATAGHVGYGGGIAGCVGPVLARMAGEFALGALARRLDRIEPDGDPRRHPGATLRAFASLPLKVYRA